MLVQLQSVLESPLRPVVALNELVGATQFSPSILYVEINAGVNLYA